MSEEVSKAQHDYFHSFCSRMPILRLIDFTDFFFTAVTVTRTPLESQLEEDKKTVVSDKLIKKSNV